MNEKLTAILIDDVPLAIETLKSALASACPSVDIIGTADGVLTGIKAIKAEQPNLVFLDIDMQDGTGFDVLDILSEADVNVIFVTGREDYALKAFQYAAIDYLLKPVDEELLKKAVEKAAKSQSFDGKQVDVLKESMDEKKENRKLALHTTEQIRIVDFSEIVRLESMGNYTQFFFNDGSKTLITRTLKEYDKLLSKFEFLRVHQSHLVNKEYIKAYVKTEGGYILMKDESIVPVSVRKKPFVVEQLGQG